MSSNYPPGVNGSEPEISGVAPDDHFDAAFEAELLEAAKRAEIARRQFEAEEEAAA